MKLLVVEDEVTLMRGIQDYFTQEDFLCEGVTTYNEAIGKIESFNYDCIILDRDSLNDKITGLNIGARRLP